MLSMHNKLRNISETNFEIFEIAKDLNKENTQYTNIDALFKTEHVINELVYNDSRFSKNITLNNIAKIIDNNLEEAISDATMYNSSFNLVNELIKDKNDDDSDLEDTNVALEFIDDFMKKINNLTVNDLMKQIDNNNKETRRSLRNEYYDLKIWKYKPTRRIYKGKTTSVLEYPFIVSVHVEEEFVCAGSIISSHFILTSASCLQIAYKNRLKPSNLPNVSARIGSDYISRYGEVVPIITIFFHPNYKPLYLKNNIAILKMEEHTYFRRNKSVRRIEFDNKNRKILEDSNQVTLVGWGSRYANPKNISLSPISYADLNIFNHDMCKNIYSSDYVTAKNFCAGFLFKGGGACYKDIGGPAIVNGVLVGIVSFGPAVCGIPKSPTVFTKLTCYYKWIQGIIQEQANKTYNYKDTVFETKNYKSSSKYDKEYYTENNFNKISKYKHDKLQHKNENNNLLRVLKGNNNNIHNANDSDENYKLYSIGDTDEGLSIEITQVTTKKQSRIKKNEHLIDSNKKEKLIEDHYVNVLESMLKVPTRNQYKHILRQAQRNASSKNKSKSNHPTHEHRIQNRFTGKSSRKGQKSTTSTKVLKPFDLYKKFMDFFKEKLKKFG